jgi:hypothetical protein
MRPFLSAAFTVALFLAFCASGPEQALARSKKQSPESVPVPSMAVDDTGTPIIMQGLQPARPAAAGRPHAPKQAKEAEQRHVHIPPGSPGFIPPISSMGPLPRTPLIGQAPAAAPYNPPPVSNPSAQISQFNQSFQFNRGLGNNPTDRDAYVRQNFNNR